ncbi:hypothetical protein [Paraburkholderia sp. J8-2]|uniref:hypothetical protein n=1 Tax=Paraburkholderia sp. J8-2 TaxID=2805440 RepID=UPI002AB6469F|nr:hypothetical protein [Paraburkholderia sp. J8-2]
MKALMVAAALAGIATTTSAFAQTPVSTAPNYGAQQPAMTQVKYVGTAAQAGQWVPPYGKPGHQESRADVYHDLVHAEKDGQLTYLNSTVFAHN